MKIKPYVDRLEKSKEYHNFHKKHKDAFMMAGFFVLDYEFGKNMHQIDFYVPKEKKIAAFTLDGEVKFQLLETMNQKIPKKLDLKTNVDLDALQGILEDEMKNRNITDEIKKIVAVIQNIDGKKLWNLNCVLSGMQILRAHVDDESRSVLKMERLSMMDLIKHVPGNMMKGMTGKGMPGAPVSENGEGKEESENVEISEESDEEELKKLDKLEEGIEKKKEEIKQKLIEKEKNQAVKSSKAKVKK